MQPRSQRSSGGWPLAYCRPPTVIHLRETAGFKIVESKAMIEPGPMEERVRPWSERLWCTPWRPWQATKMVPTVRPRKDVLRVGDMLIMHPEVANQIRLAAELHG